VAQAGEHRTVLLDEAVDALLERAGEAPAGLWVDATFGRGGHTRRILSRLSPQGRLLAFDKDPQAIEEAARIQDARFCIRHQGFRHLAELPAGSVAGVLMDLGVIKPPAPKPPAGYGPPPGYGQPYQGGYMQQPPPGYGAQQQPPNYGQPTGPPASPYVQSPSYGAHGWGGPTTGQQPAAQPPGDSTQTIHTSSTGEQQPPTQQQ